MENKILIVFGTRPEIIKLFPIIKLIKEENLLNNFVLVNTNQHENLTLILQNELDIIPDIILSVPHEKSLAGKLSFILSGLQNVIESFDSASIAGILGQGDTLSCLAASMTAFLNKIKFLHIESGLRTYNLENPFPEEYFRQIISLSSSLNFAPNENSRKNLLAEGVPDSKIIVSGNTIVDTMKLLTNKESGDHPKNKVLITCHRRENQNQNLITLIKSVHQLGIENTDFEFIWISHPAPFILNILNKYKDAVCFSILRPQSLSELYKLYKQTAIIITDSGGIQEEAVTFKIPTIIVRKCSDRNESIELGYSILSDPAYESINSAFQKFKLKKPHFQESPFGHGNSSSIILQKIKDDLLRAKVQH